MLITCKTQDKTARIFNNQKDKINISKNSLNKGEEKRKISKIRRTSKRHFLYLRNEKCH